MNERRVGQPEFISLCWLSGMGVQAAEDFLVKTYGDKAVLMYITMLWKLRFDQMQQVSKRNAATGL